MSDELEFKVTRVEAEEPDVVRERDAADIDALYYKDGRRVGDPGSGGDHHVFGSTEGMTSADGGPPRRRTRR
jgi:hypothetical protein